MLQGIYWAFEKKGKQLMYEMYSLILNLLMLHGRRLVFSLSLLIRTDKKAGVRLITLRQVWCDIPASTVDLFLRPDWNLAATFCFFSSTLQSSPRKMGL